MGVIYPEASKPISTNVPGTRGNPVTSPYFFDADHTASKSTISSQTGVLIFVNRTPIVWYSNHQSTVESSTFGLEFIGMKKSVDLIEALRYKIRLMGIPMDRTTSLFYNKAVIINTTTPEPIPQA